MLDSRQKTLVGTFSLFTMCSDTPMSKPVLKKKEIGANSEMDSFL